MKYISYRLLSTAIIALAIASCGPRSRDYITLDDFMKLRPDQYDSMGLVKEITNADMGNWSAEFYIMKYDAAVYDKNKAAALENIQLIMYWYNLAKNTEQLSKWYRIKKKIEAGE